MKTHYVLDGYNLLFYLCHNSSEPIDILRLRLISLLGQATQVSFTLVFDAHKRTPSPFYEEDKQTSSQKQIHNTRIVYTSYSQSADHFLQDYFHALWGEKSPKKAKKGAKSTIMLVTSDNALGHSIAALGFNWIKANDFASRLANHIAKAKQKSNPFQAPPHRPLKQKKPSTPKATDSSSPLFFTEEDFNFAPSEEKQQTQTQILPNIGDIEGWTALFEEQFNQHEREKD